MVIVFCIAMLLVMGVDIVLAIYLIKEDLKRGEQKSKNSNNILQL